MTITQKKRKNFRGKLELKDVGVRYLCNACQNDITDQVRVRCAECADVDMCLDCFSAGVDVLTHQKTHSYRVMRSLAFPIFSADWGADEELLLLEGIELLGLGNWQDIADHVVTKSKQECEKHYHDVYTHSPSSPVPDMTKNFSPGEEQLLMRRRKELNLPLKNRNEDLEKPQSSQPANHEIAGLMPNRKEFETEYDNDAELIVRDMQFAEDDLKTDMDLKLSILDVYNNKLDRRIERKKLIVDRDLTDFKKQQSLERRRTKEERELFNRMRVFSRFQTSKDFNTFMEGLLYEQKLRLRIVQLQEWRRMGVTSLAGGEYYEADKRKRETELSLRKSKESSSYSYGDRSYGSSISSSLSGSLRTIIDPSSLPRVTMSLPTPKQARKPGTPLDISSAESVELLNPRERELCSQIRLFPKQYLSIKETFISEYNRRGGLRRLQARALVKVDVNKSGRIYDYLFSAGWIKPPASEPSN